MSASASRARYAACLADCEELIKIVERKNKINFKTFAEAWQEMNFSLIFCGHTTVDELCTFSEDLIQAAKSLWLPPTPAKQRLIAGYLMYGIYFKQPLRHTVKIKVTKDEWAHIAVYYQFTCQFQLHESYYMFCRLIEDDAFSFVATAHEVRLDSINTRHADAIAAVSQNMEEFTKDENGMQELVSSGILEDIAAIDEQYESGTKQLKEALSGHQLPDLTKKEVAQTLRNMCLESLEYGAEAKQKVQQQISRPSSRVSSKSMVHDNARASSDGNDHLASRKAVDEDHDANAGTSSHYNKVEDDKPETIGKRRRRQRGYHMMKNFKQSKVVECVIDESHCVVHSTSTRTLNINSAYNIAQTKPGVAKLVSGVNPIKKKLPSEIQKKETEEDDKSELQDDSRALITDDSDDSYTVKDESTSDLTSEILVSFTKLNLEGDGEEEEDAPAFKSPHSSPGDVLKWKESGSTSSYELKYNTDSSSTVVANTINSGTTSNLSMPEL